MAKRNHMNDPLPKFRKGVSVRVRMDAVGNQKYVPITEIERIYPVSFGFLYELKDYLGFFTENQLEQI